MYNNMADEESGELVDNFEFSEKSIRLGFIRKVYSILSIQLLVTIAIISLFIFVEPVRLFSVQNPWLWWVAFAATFICLIALACCPNVRRSFPTNIIFLGVFTCCEGFLLGTVSSRYDTDAVLMAAGITTVVAVSLTVFSFQTKIDFTMCSGVLFVLLIVLMLFGIICIIIRDRYATIAYASLGALIFAMYLVVDTQMMMGGKHKYSLSPEEYIFAALNLYLDIVNLFLFILTIIGAARN